MLAPADFQSLKRLHERTLARLPDLLLGMVNDLSGNQAYHISRRDHSLQAATRALRDGADEELIVQAGGMMTVMQYQGFANNLQHTGSPRPEGRLRRG